MHQPPYIEVPDSEGACWGGWAAIGKALQQHLQRLGKPKAILTVECYPGTYSNIDMGFLKSTLSPNVVCRAEDLFLEERDIRQRIGVSFSKAPRADADLPSTVASYFDPQKLASIQATIAEIETGIILIHGVGAHLIAEPDVLVYSDVSRYELIQRLRRKDITNVGVDNRELSYTTQYAWSYFIDWPLGDHIKQALLPDCDYVLETNNWQRAKMVKGEAVRRGLEIALQQPISPSPFFDPELWDAEDPKGTSGDLGVNFHLRIEEDNLLFKICDQLFETPVVNLLFHNASAFLGGDVRNRYGDRLPFYIQFFDNLKQQLHNINFYPPPVAMVEYFGKMARHQDYYYAVKARKNAVILAGVSRDHDASNTETLMETLPSEKDWRRLLEAYPVQSRDILAIPAGIVHSTGTGCQLLNIGIATPFFRQHLLSKKAGKRPHLPTPEASVPQKLHPLHSQLTPPHSLEVNPYEHSPIRLTHLSEGSMIELPDKNRVQVICVVEGETAQLHYGDNQSYQLQFGQVVVLPAALKHITWSAESGTRAILIEIT